MSRLQKFLLLSISLQFCAAFIFAMTDSEDRSDPVLKLFPGYHLLTIAERDSDTRAFIQENLPKQNPSLIHADFDGDGHPDYALLLKGDQSENAKFVVLLCPDDNACKQVFELGLTGSPEIMYLRKKAAKSRISQTDSAEDHDQPSDLKLTGTGIELNYFEKGVVVYYWDKAAKKICSMQTED